MVNLPTVNRTTAAQDVILRLRHEITSGGIAPGTQLGEVQLSKRFEVGRAPIREALRQLMQEGLVVHEPHRGSSVVVLTERDLEDIYIARQGIERRAVQLLLQRGDDADLGGIADALEVLRQAPSGPRPTPAVVEADVAFHEAIVAAAGSPRLHRMFRTLSAETQMYLLQAHPPYDPESYVAEHQKLAAAILERRADAPDVIVRHLSESRAVVARTLSGDAPLAPTG